MNILIAFPKKGRGFRRGSRVRIAACGSVLIPSRKSEGSRIIRLFFFRQAIGGNLLRAIFSRDIEIKLPSTRGEDVRLVLIIQGFFPINCLGDGFVIEGLDVERE